MPPVLLAPTFSAPRLTDAPDLRAPLARLREAPDFFEADLRPAEDLLAEEDFLPARLLLLALPFRPLPLRAEDLLACLPPVFLALLFLAGDFLADDFFAEAFFADQLS